MDEFYRSPQWLKLRFMALRASDRSCALCGATASRGVKLHVDHIKPRSKYPELALDFENLQILCGDCNMGKGNDCEINWSDQSRRARAKRRQVYKHYTGRELATPSPKKEFVPAVIVRKKRRTD